METFVPKTTLYPLFLSLTGLHCLLVGLGQVGQRKLAGLLACDPASVLVLDPHTLTPQDSSLLSMLNDGRVRLECRICTADDIHGKALVFAATGSVAENQRIAALCRNQSVLCNCASAPDDGNFQVPAVARSAPLAAALSTGGASPALARRWKDELTQWLVPRARMAALMGRLRPMVLALNAETVHNTKLFRKLTASPLQQWLEDGDLENCRQWLLAELPSELHAHIAELLYDLP